MVKFFFLTFTALVLFVAGVMLIAWLPRFIHNQIEKDFRLANPTTKLYNTFVNQSEDVHIYKIFTFYNITNLPDVINGTAYPNVTEFGPYYYERVRVRSEDEITWQPNGTIHYRWTETYMFKSELSRGAESDMITTARLGPLFAYQTVSATSFPSIGKIVFADKATAVGSLFVTKNVSDLVHGYKDNFLVELYQPDPYIAVAPDEYNVSFSECYNGAKPSTTQPDVPDRSFAQMTMWKGNRDLSAFWTTAETKVLRGTDGSTQAPFLHDVDEVTAFVEALRRPIILAFAGPGVADDTDGVEGTRRYQPRWDQFTNYNETPYNTGYRIFQTGFQPRPPVIDVADNDILGAISKMHYLDCTGPYMNVDIGAPNRERDETHLEFEPYTATLVRVNKRSMLNAMLRPIYFKDVFGFTQVFGDSKDLKQTWLPYVGEDEAMDLSPRLKDQLKRDVIVPLKIAKPIGGTLVGIAVVIEILAIYFCFIRKSKEEENEKAEVYSQGESPF